MKDRKYDKCHVRSKNHSGCLETLCHVRGPLRNKMSHSDSDPSTDPVPGQTMLPTVSLTYPEPFKMDGFKKAPGMSDSVKLTVGSTGTG